MSSDTDSTPLLVALVALLVEVDVDVLVALLVKVDVLVAVLAAQAMGVKVLGNLAATHTVSV